VLFGGMPPLYVDLESDPDEVERFLRSLSGE
jgi:hypothetical protein